MSGQEGRESSLDRFVDQCLEAAGQLGQGEGDIPVRRRGGFREPELNTKPENIIALRAQNIAGLRQIDILTNFVELTAMDNREVHMYRIEFQPNIESASLMRFLFKTVAKSIFSVLPSYDGAHECRSGQRLPERVTTAQVINRADENKTEYNVSFTHTGTVGFGPEGLRLYNMHMKDFLRHMGFYQPQVGLYVHSDHSTPIGNEIMMMRGFRTSASLHEDNKIFMNLEGAHKLVQQKNVLQHMESIRHNSRGSNLREAIEAEMVGKTVVTSYNKRVYRVEAIDFKKRPSDSFDRNGTEISFLEYYRSVHNLTITDRQQPLLRCVPNNQRRRDEASREVLIVPEFCNIAGLTEQQRTDSRLTLDLIRASQVPPTDRVRHVRQFLATLHSNEDVKRQLNEWGYSYEADAVKLKAYVIPATKIAFGPTINRPMTDWLRSNPETADFNVNGLAVVPTIKKMVIITTRIDLRCKQIILDRIREGFNKVGLILSKPPQCIDVQEGDSSAHYISSIRNISSDADLAIVIMHSQDKERYEAIKKVASVEKGLVTQVVNASLMMNARKATSAATKIAIQIAAKVGGEPWWADIPLKKAMVCGYDTYHDTTQRGRSFGAFLASMNVRFSRWWSKADAHDRPEEMSAQVAANMTEAVKQYRNLNNAEFPERVIIYRDGVGEGQLEHVFRVELERIKEALDSLGAPMQIRLTMIIVNKGIGARFFMRAGDGFANPPPGTIIDHTVTLKYRYDFYLVSQSTRNGTVTPTYYNVIHDDSSFSPEIHHKMAFKFCLMYYNWSGTFRVPAPCQYAHKLAYLCGEHLHAPPNANLEHKLHFL